MKLFQLLVSTVELLHEGLCHEQAFFKLLDVQAFQVCDAEALIGFLEEGALSDRRVYPSRLPVSRLWRLYPVT